MRNVIAPLAAALALTACNPGPKPAACTPAAMPAALATGESDSTYRFRIARACIDNAAHSLRHTLAANIPHTGRQAVAACVTEVRAAMLVATSEETQMFMLDSGVPTDVDGWETYTTYRIHTFRQRACGF